MNHSRRVQGRVTAKRKPTSEPSGAGMAKHYGVRGDLTTGGPVNFRMRRNPFPIRVKLTMR